MKHLLLVLMVASHTANAAVRKDTAVLIGGIRQWISVRGADEHKPVLLFLHGGPGNSAMGSADRFTLDLQKEFLVVFWDQRETGKTKTLSTKTDSLSVAKFESDAVSMIQFLCARYHQPKVFLMGLSWGGFLALMVAWHHPEWLNACFAISPMIFQIESEQRSLAWMKERAQREGNHQATVQLNTIRIPFENGEQLHAHRYWLAKANGQRPSGKAYVLEWSKKWLPLFNEASHIDFRAVAPQIRCPIYFFIGRHDYQTHFELAEQYATLVKAPQKELFWFEHSGHVLNLSEPAKLQDIILHRILPNLSR